MLVNLCSLCIFKRLRYKLYYLLAIEKINARGSIFKKLNIYLASRNFLSILNSALLYSSIMEDLQSFQEFFEYKPCTEENPIDILENILSKARKYLKPEEIDEIVRTYEFTREAHK